MCSTYIQVESSKIKATRSIKVFAMSDPWIHAYMVRFICGTNTTHDVMMCYAPGPDRRIKGQSHMSRSYLKCWPVGSYVVP